jgi:hypothetical protein
MSSSDLQNGAHEPREQQNPWHTIWTAPRVTVRAVLRDNPREWLWVFVVAGGLSRVLGRLAELDLPDGSVSSLLPAILVAGPVAGAVLIFGIGRVLHMVLVRLGGTGSWIASRTAIAWSLAPSVPSVALWLIMIASYGPGVLAPGAIENAPNQMTRFILSIDYAIQFGLTMWMLVLEVLTLADVHKISPWRVLVGEAIVGIALVVLTYIVLSAI